MGKICVIASALSNHLLKRLRLQKKELALLLVVVLLIITGNAHAITVTGVFEDNDTSELDAYIHFHLTTESIVSLTYTDSCANPNNAKIELFTSWEARVAWSYIKDIQQPFKMPLAAGHWTARISCDNEWYDANNPVAYELEQSYVEGSSQYTKDSEPDSTSDEAITLTSGKSVTGWIGYMGYEALRKPTYPDQDWGIDDSDIHYYDIAKGTRIKIRMDYDTTLIEARPDRDIAILYSYIKEDGEAYRYFPFGLGGDDNWQFSGDETDEFVIPNDAIYGFKIIGGYPLNGDAYRHYPKENYGGYKMTVIVNGEEPEEPNAEIEAIQKISTTYWDKSERKYLTVDSLVPGWESDIYITIINHGSSSIETILKYGLSIEGGPVKLVGINYLSLAGGATTGHTTTLLTPDDTPFPRTGSLVPVLYDSDKNVLDTSQKVINVWSPKVDAAVMFMMMYYINQ